MNSDIKVGSLILGMIQTNCYYVYRDCGSASDNSEKHCIIFDPADNGESVYEELTKKNFVIDLILLTHAHFDHIGGVEALVRLSKARVFCYEGERRLCSDTDANLSAMFGRPTIIKPDEFLKDLAVIDAAGMKCQLIATPGHTEGSACYYFEEGHILMCGDTLFCGSVGRTDMPTGSMSSIVKSVRERLMILPDDTECFPGHGETTTIGYERKYNEFI